MQDNNIYPLTWEVTLWRCWCRMSTYEKLRFAIMLACDSFESITKETIEELKDADTMTKMMAELAQAAVQPHRTTA